MKFFKALFVSSLFYGSVALATDQVNCSQELNNNSQIFQLMSLIKNEVLGTVPKFCRTDGHEQLAEQNDEGEEALSNFVRQLKNLNPNDNDTVAYDFGKSEEVENVIFNTFKMVILKKMWQQSGPDNQYSLLLSQDCEDIGLNRFPIQKGTKEFEKNIEKDKKKALSAANEVCSSRYFKVIAPYVTKDVLAEALLNLKSVFPKSFPKLVDSLCTSLKAEDNLLWKNDKYSSFAKPKLSLDSSKEFSSWLKRLYGDIANKDKLDVENNKQVELFENLADFTITPYVNEQKELNKIFTNAQKGKSEQNPISYHLDDDFILKKNSKGIILRIPNEKVAEQFKEAEEIYAALKDEEYKKIQKDLKSAYEIQAKGKSDKQIPVENFPGYFIVKKKNGSYAYVLDESGKAEIEKIKKINQDKLKHPAFQKQLKTMYELQQEYVDDDGKNYFPKDYSAGIIEKLSDGSYAVKSSKNSIVENSTRIIALKLSADNIEIPIPTDSPGVVKVKGVSGAYEEVLIYDPSKKNVETGNLEYELNKVIMRRYQNETSDGNNFDQLSLEEMNELRAYTSNSYKAINSCLRKSNCDAVETKKINAIISGLTKLKKSKLNTDDLSSDDYQILFRGAKELPSFVKKGLDKNATNFILDKGFMSSTGNIETARNFAGSEGHVFVMRTKSCVGISSLSEYSSEDEFLCPPGMKFTVKKMSGVKGAYLIEEESKKEN